MTYNTWHGNGVTAIVYLNQLYELDLLRQHYRRARKEPSRSLPWDRERPTILGYPARLLRCEAERELNFFDAFGPIFSLLGPTPFHCKSVK